MNWYIKQIFAQSAGLQGYLENLGATPDIVQYIMSLDSKLRESRGIRRSNGKT